jgi:hypothetical protein
MGRACGHQVGEKGLGKTTLMKNLAAGFNPASVKEGCVRGDVGTAFLDQPSTMCTDICVPGLPGGHNFHYLIQVPSSPLFLPFSAPTAPWNSAPRALLLLLLLSSLSPGGGGGGLGSLPVCVCVCVWRERGRGVLGEGWLPLE